MLPLSTGGAVERTPRMGLSKVAPSCWQQINRGLTHGWFLFAVSRAVRSLALGKVDHYGVDTYEGGSISLAWFS